MEYLFVHQNFPGQFKHLAPAIAADPRHRVTAFTMCARTGMPGVRTVRYAPARGNTPAIHPWLGETESKIIRGEAAWRAARQLAARGWRPDVIYAHPGWGESLFLRDVWPDARLVLFCEYYYLQHGGDVNFDPEFPSNDPSAACRMRMKNLNNLLALQAMDAGISPTRWQRETFPDPWRQHIDVVHDGVDTDAVAPRPDARLELAEGLIVSRDDELITFVNRNLEPLRGYHRFMRALPDILARRPRARVLIVGGDSVSYGAAAPTGRRWREVFLDEVRNRIDPSRVHFLGNLDYRRFVTLLQVSTVHVYLSYPFVLSWSLVEAMSAGCAIVAGDTAPVREAIDDGDTGRLVDFFSNRALADAVTDLLADPAERARLGRRARACAQARYDLRRVCLPRQLELLGAGRPAGIPSRNAVRAAVARPVSPDVPACGSTSALSAP